MLIGVSGVARETRYSFARRLASRGGYLLEEIVCRSCRGLSGPKLYSRLIDFYVSRLSTALSMSQHRVIVVDSTLADVAAMAYAEAMEARDRALRSRLLYYSSEALLNDAAFPGIYRVLVRSEPGSRLEERMTEFMETLRWDYVVEKTEDVDGVLGKLRYGKLEAHGLGKHPDG